MKWFGIQFFIAISTCFFAIAHDNYAQLLDRKITLHAENVSLEEAISQIRNQNQIHIIYSVDALDLSAKVSITVDDEALRTVLDKLLNPYHIGYTVFEESTIVLNRANVTHKTDDKSSSSTSLPPPIGGTVRDAKGLLLAGVNIIVSGTTKGTTTDNNGAFTLDVEPGESIVFSFIGYKTQTFRLEGQTQLDVILEEDVSALSEVTVNAGYYRVKEDLQTGNISRVSAADISKQPVGNPLAALEGRMPGVQITQTTGVPGGAFNIKIRGQNSLRSDGNAPLYIVDGVPFTATSLTSQYISGSIIGAGSPLSAINPSDIESIEVLKDADATAIYGSRGSNGVVLITTKKGKAGKTKVDVSFRSGFENVAHNLNLLNTPQYLQMRHEAFKNDNRAITESRAPDLVDWDTTRSTNWQKQLIGKTAHTTNAQVGISGGDERTQFSLGGAYFKETTVFPGDFAFQRLSGSLSMNHRSQNGRFTAAASVNYSSTTNHMFYQDLTAAAVRTPPNAPALYTPDGKINDWQTAAFPNPLYAQQKQYKNNMENLVANGTLSYEIADGLHIKTNLGITSMNVNEIATFPISSIPAYQYHGQTGSSNFGNSSIKTWIIEPQINYSRKLTYGTISALAGGTFQNSLQQGQTVQATGYTSDALLEDIRGATAVNAVDAQYSQYRYAAGFARFNYSLKERYIFNLTGRRDGSSRFGPGKQFGNFGAVGAAWIFSEGRLVKNSLPFITFGKLRASYGTTGSDNIGNYQYLKSYTATQYAYNSTRGLSVSRLYNPDYSWETNKKFEAGIDLGLFREDIRFSVSYYSNRSSNQLVGLPLPLITGQSSVQYNFPATVRNSGWEFSVSAALIKQSSFRWTVNFNATIPTSTLVKFPNIESFPSYNNSYQVGSSVFKKKTLVSKGVDPATGLYTFKDLNGDGNVDFDFDQSFSKSISQKYYGGLGNSFTYKGWQLDIFMQFVKQTGYNYLNFFPAPGNFSMQPDLVMNRWTESGNTSSIQKFTSISSSAYSNQISSNAAISDASFIRLKNVSFSWQIPAVWTQRALITNARIFVQGQNLFTITRYVGLDPENMTISSLPPLRVVAVGAQLTF